LGYAPRPNSAFSGTSFIRPPLSVFFHLFGEYVFLKNCLILPHLPVPCPTAGRGRQACGVSFRATADFGIEKKIDIYKISWYLSHKAFLQGAK